MTTLQDLQDKIAAAHFILLGLQGEADVILQSAEHNTFATREDADLKVRRLLYERAEIDCGSSYCCGEDEYIQEFMVGTQKYQATMTVEYNRIEKRYYYIDSSKYTSKEI